MQCIQYHTTSFDVNVIGLGIIVKLFLRCFKDVCVIPILGYGEDLSLSRGRGVST